MKTLSEIAENNIEFQVENYKKNIIGKISDINIICLRDDSNCIYIAERNKLYFSDEFDYSELSEYYQNKINSIIDKYSYQLL